MRALRRGVLMGVARAIIKGRSSAPESRTLTSGRDLTKAHHSTTPRSTKAMNSIVPQGTDKQYGDGDHLFAVAGSQVATTTDDWYTPRWIFDAAGIEFDMDVASPMDPAMQHVPARRFVTAVEDGLTTPWVGTVWCNPPYSGSTPWVEKFAAHDGAGMLLVPAVKSRWVGTMLNAADAFTLLTVEFHRPGGEVAPIRWLNMLVGKGAECAAAVSRVAAVDKHAAGGYLVRGVA